MRKTKLIAVLMASLVLIYTSCSEKEVTQQVEDTARVDALRKELFELQRLIYGTDGGAEGIATMNERLELDNKSLEDQIEILQEEVNRLFEAYNAGVSYEVIAIDFQGNPIAGATVTINENGTVVTGTTDATGTATFEEVRAGWIVAVVSATGFATANYGTSLYSMSSAGVNTRVPLLPKSGTLAESSMFTISGSLYANLNTANDTLTGFRYGSVTNIMFTGSKTANRLAKGPLTDYAHKSFDKQNKKLRATMYMDRSQIPFSSYYNGNQGAIRYLAYEGVQWEAVIDANNNYTLKLPVDPAFNGINFSFRFSAEEFSATKTMVDFDVNGVWYDYLSYDGNDYETLPVSAFPAPKTFTQNRVFRLGGYVFGNNGFSGFYSDDTFTFDTGEFGTSSLGAIAGQTYTLDFYYRDFRN